MSCQSAPVLGVLNSTRWGKGRDAGRGGEPVCVERAARFCPLKSGAEGGGIPVRRKRCSSESSCGSRGESAGKWEGRRKGAG